MKHTPSPWKACREHESFEGDIIYLDGEDLAEYNKLPYVRICAGGQVITTNHDFFEFKNPYDALLIASAPELLNCLNSVLCMLLMANRPQDKQTIKYIQDTIKKATGEE